MNDKNKVLEKFGKHLAKLREAQEMSIRQFAAASGLEYSQVQRIEKGKVNLAFTTLMNLAQGLSLEPSSLLEGFKIPK
jgi:transcriptional regulator with XRE-family HTH domain